MELAEQLQVTINSLNDRAGVIAIPEEDVGLYEALTINVENIMDVVDVDVDEPSNLLEDLRVDPQFTGEYSYSENVCSSKTFGETKLNSFC